MQMISVGVGISLLKQSSEVSFDIAHEREVASFIGSIYQQESNEALCASLSLLVHVGVCFSQS